MEKIKKILLNNLDKIWAVIYVIFIIVLWELKINNILKVLLFILFLLLPRIIAKIYIIYNIIPFYKVVTKFNKDCDVDCYIKNLSKIMDKSKKIDVKEVFKMYVIIGKIFKDGYSEKLLNELLKLDSTLIGKKNDFTLKINIINTYRHLGNLDKVKELISELDNEENVNEKESVERVKMLCKLEEKDYDGVENYFTSSLMKQKTTLGKVIDNSILGEYYFEIKDYSKAKTCFDFIIEHGNNLHCVSEAKKFNKKIENK